MSEQREEVRVTKADTGFLVQHRPAAVSYDEQSKYTTEHGFSNVSDLVNYLINTLSDV